MNKALTPKQIEEILCRAKAASGGPINIERREDDTGYFRFVGYCGDDIFVCDEMTNPDAKKNAIFYAHARADIFALCNTINIYKRLYSATLSTCHDVESECDELYEQIDYWKGENETLREQLAQAEQRVGELEKKNAMLAGIIEI